MAKFELVISERAADAFHAAFNKAKEASLIGAESLRAAWLAKLHKLGADPVVDSRLEDGAQLPGELRSTAIKSYRFFFVIQATRIVVLDVVVDAASKQRSSGQA